MLDLLTGGLPSLLGGGLGIIGAALPQLFEWLRAPGKLRDLEARNAHEIKMLELNIKANESASAGRIEEVRAEQDGIADVEKQISQTKLALASSPWVRNICALIRPGLTLAIFCVWALVKYAVIKLAFNTGAGFEAAVISAWNPEDQAMMSAIIAFWFTGRYLNDKKAGSGSRT